MFFFFPPENMREGLFREILSSLSPPVVVLITIGLLMDKFSSWKADIGMILISGPGLALASMNLIHLSIQSSDEALRENALKLSPVRGTLICGSLVLFGALLYYWGNRKSKNVNLSQ